MFNEGMQILIKGRPNVSLSVGLVNMWCRGNSLLRVGNEHKIFTAGVAVGEVKGRVVR